MAGAIRVKQFYATVAVKSFLTYRKMPNLVLLSEGPVPVMTATI